MYTKVKTSAEIEAMRESGRMLATVLAKLSRDIQAGMSTKDLSAIAKAELKSLGGQPAFLGYGGFPDVLCVSVNDEVVHGIPRDSHIIHDGDVVSMDFGVSYRSMITDSAVTVIVGNGTKQNIDLVRATKESLDAGIMAINGKAQIGDIGAAVQAVLEKGGYGIVRDLVGHGVGHEIHEEPNIANYGKKGMGAYLQAGMTIAVEPMATLGGYKVVTDPDNWTIRTADGSIAAHFEHTILVTQDGAEVLTSL